MSEFSAADHQHMARALELARRGDWTTHPNPRVGCVLVREGNVVGEGWHRRAGGPHAEVEALAQAGSAARGATAYVTLEPCAHQGRTPPCCDALIEAGVGAVVAAMEDPFPAVAGKGLSRLRAAGLTVREGLMQAQAEALNCGFLARVRRGRPWVRIKLAASLDGRTAMASGESRWISGEASRADVQAWRARASAILSGSGTVLQDDPRLDVRVEGAERQPVRVVLDSGFRLEPQARIFDRGGPVWLIGHESAEMPRWVEERGGEAVRFAGDRGRPDLAAVMAWLASREINEVHVEAGATLCGALLEARLVDEFLLYLAPHLMGDAARGLFVLPGLECMDHRVNLEWLDARRIGNDLRLRLRPHYATDETP